jgi:hypothetical protein
MNKIKIIGAVFFGVAALAAVAQEDYSSWAHTKAITLNTAATGGGAGVTGSVGGFPVLVRLTAAQSEIFTQAKAGGADIRFRRLPGPHLPYQIERWDTAAKAAEIWVRLDTVLGANSTQTFNIYWGKPSAADSSRGAAVFDTGRGYQGTWHFAGNLADATRNGIVAADEGTTDVPGLIGRARGFNGTGRVVLDISPKMSSGDADRFTVESWVNWTSIGTGATDRYRCIISHGTTNNADQFFMYARNPSSGGDEPYYAVGYYTGSVSNNATMTGIAADGGAWVHVTGVYDGAEWRVYRNGVLGGSAPKDGMPVNSADNWVIGAWGTSRNFLGSMDEIRFSNRVRSDAWIKLAYETQKAGATALTFGPTTVPVSVRSAVPGVSGAARIDAVASGLAFRLPSGMGSALMVILDLKGRMIWSREAELGSAETSVLHNRLPSGSYVARVVIREQGMTERAMQRTVAVP